MFTIEWINIFNILFLFFSSSLLGAAKKRNRNTSLLRKSHERDEMANSVILGK